jgi:hypothetical protein
VKPLGENPELYLGILLEYTWYLNTRSILDCIIDYKMNKIDLVWELTLYTDLKIHPTKTPAA